jgi:hypothetical protein
VVIQRGQQWGTPGGLPADAPIVADDVMLSNLLRGGTRPSIVGLVGGDLCRTMGGPRTEAALRPAEVFRLPVDLGWVSIDGGPERPFVAHVVARRSSWHGRVVAVMNGQFIGAWDVAPRSHPNDGRLDVMDVDPAMGLGERWKARRRLVTGTHVPHPLIAERRVTSWDTSFTTPLTVYVDGMPVGAARTLAVRCEPDALTVVV